MPWVTVLVLAWTSMLAVWTGAVVAPTLQGLATAWGASKLEVQVLLTLPALTLALAGAPAGRSVDRWGPKPVLLAGLGLTTVAAAMGVLAGGVPALAAARALQGVAGGCVQTAASSWLIDAVTAERRAGAVAVQSVGMGLGGILGPILGGALAAAGPTGPFYAFAVAVPMSVAVAWLPPLARPPRAPGSLAARSVGAKVPAWFLAAGFLGMLGFYVLPVQISFLLHEALGLGPQAAGRAIAVMTLPGLLLGLVFARVRAALGPRVLLAASFVLPAVGYVWLSTVDAMLALTAALLVVGLGFAPLMPNLTLWLAEHTPPESRGRATGWLQVAFFSGQFASPLVVAAALGSAPASTVFAVAGWSLPLAGVALALTRR
jgi:ACDE family multidrug resistance protein